MSGLELRPSILHLRAITVAWITISILSFCSSFGYCDEDAVTSISITGVGDCTKSASATVGCSGEDDLDCTCTTDYTMALLLCLESSYSATSDTTALDEAATQLYSICSTHMPLNVRLCTDCASSAVSAVTCLDYMDYACLCDADGDKYQSVLTTCLETHTSGSISCAAEALPMFSFASDNCEMIKAATISYNGCTACQASVASELDCSGSLDYECLCTEDEYRARVSSCIESETSCGIWDQTLARNSYTSVCSALLAGETPILPTTSLASTFARETRPPPGASSTDEASSSIDGDSQDAADDDDDDDVGGPATAEVVGIVVGAVAGLSLLLVGGYWIFRERSHTFGSAGEEKMKNKKLNRKWMMGVILRPWTVLPCFRGFAAAPTITSPSNAQASLSEMPASSANRKILNGGRGPIEMEGELALPELEGRGCGGCGGGGAGGVGGYRLPSHPHPHPHPHQHHIHKRSTSTFTSTSASATASASPRESIK